MKIRNLTIYFNFEIYYITHFSLNHYVVFLGTRCTRTCPLASRRSCPPSTSRPRSPAKITSKFFQILSKSYLKLVWILFRLISILKIFPSLIWKASQILRQKLLIVDWKDKEADIYCIYKLQWKLPLIIGPLAAT